MISKACEIYRDESREVWGGGGGPGGPGGHKEEEKRCTNALEYTMF